MNNDIVSLNIKNVYDGGSTTTIKVPVKETIVKKLKEIIQKQNPDHPDPKDQRIIYCGKICKDETKISEILISQMDQSVSQTFHLVLSRSPSSTPKKLDKKDTNQSPALARHNTSPPVLPSQTPSPSPAQLPVSSPAPAPVVSTFPSVPTQAHGTVGDSNSPVSAQDVAHHLLRANCDPKYLAHQYLLQAWSQLTHTAKSSGPRVVADGGHLAMAQAAAHAQQMATHWHMSFPQPPSGTQVQVFQYTLGSTAQPQRGGQEPGVTAGIPQQQNTNVANNNQRMARWAFLILDIKLLLKLCFMIFMLGQGRDFSTVFGLCACALAVYFAQTGLLRSLWQQWQQPAGPLNPNQAPPPAQNNNNNNLPHGNNVPAAQQPQQPPTIFQLPSGLHRGAIAPSRGNRVADALVLTGTFFLSLLPMWRPVADESAEVQQPAAENNQQNQDANQDNRQDQPQAAVPVHAIG